VALSAFEDKTAPPTAPAVAKTIGRTAPLWSKIRKHLAREYEPVSEAWKFYSRKSGWCLQVKRRKRTILYMIPCKGFFLVAFVLGEEAVQSARTSNLSAQVVGQIDAARKYIEGRGMPRVMPSSPDDARHELGPEVTFYQV
jgi:hypothetical protein